MRQPLTEAGEQAQGTRDGRTESAVTTRSLRRSVFASAGLMVALGLLAAVPGAAQVEDQAATPAPAPTPTPAPTPIPASGIPARVTDDAGAAREAVTRAEADPRLLEIQRRLPAAKARVEDLREEMTRRIEMPGPAQMLNDVGTASMRLRDRLTRWLAELAVRSSALDSALGDLQGRTAVWRLTRENQA